MADPRRQLESAIQAYQRGDLPTAQSLCQKVLKRDKKHSDALHISGVIHARCAEFPQAIEQLEKAVKAAPQNVAFHNSLATALLDSGNLEAATRAYHQALKCEPSHPQAQFGIVRILLQSGQLNEAQAVLDKACAKPHPLWTEGFCQLGQIYFEQELFADSRRCLERALALNPQHVFSLQNLAVLDLEQDQVKAALQRLELVMKLAPQDVQSLYLYGVALRRSQRQPEAAPVLKKLCASYPDFLNGHLAFAHTLLDMGHAQEAEAVLQECLKTSPTQSALHAALSQALLDQGKAVAAEQSARHAIRTHKKGAKGHERLALALFEQAEPEAAQQAFQDALSCEARADTYSSLLWTLNHCSSERQALREASAGYAETFGPKEIPVSTPAPLGERRLRIGYFSPDLRQHSVAYFLEPILAAHDKTRVEVFCYSLHPQQDAVTERLRAHTEHWRACAGMNDAELADCVRADALDILVELAGHTVHNRLLCLAQRPAPIQISYLGYPAATGLPWIDFQLSDVQADPPQLAAADKVLRLPRSYFCYRPAPSAREMAVGALPALSQAHVTFGSFNNYAKISAQTVSLWAAVLKAVPDSRLLLKCRGLSDPELQAKLVQRFEAEGIAPERLQLHAYAASLEEHLALYQQVDIGLDSWPFNGATTTCEALWMGVPVLSLSAETHASRMGRSLLSAVQLEDWLAEDHADFVHKAQNHAANLPLLASLRAGMRSRLQDSPLLDEAGFTQDLEALYLSLLPHE